MTTGVSITGLGSYLPGRVLANDALPPLRRPLDAEQLDRIGVHGRHWAGDEDVPAMALAAARRALDRAGLEPRAVDLIILSNWTERRYIPELAPRVKALLDADRAVAFDICCACAGFLFGVGLAHEFLRGGRCRRALVVAAETTSRRARPGSRATLVYSDGAGAFVLERTAAGTGTLIDCELMTDGDLHGVMDVDAEGYVRSYVPQRVLVSLAARSIVDAGAALLRRNGLELADVDWVVPHSGTAGVQAHLRTLLDIAPDRILTNFADIGNLSSASIPVALDQFVTTGVIRPGQLILSASVGIGWQAAGALYTL